MDSYDIRPVIDSDTKGALGTFLFIILIFVAGLLSVMSINYSFYAFGGVFLYIVIWLTWPEEEVEE